MSAKRKSLLTLMVMAGLAVPVSAAFAQFFSADPVTQQAEEDVSSERLSVDAASEPAPAPMPEIKDKAPTTWYDYPEIELRALDKVTAKATTFKMKVGETVRFNEIYIKVQTCRKPPAIEKQESAAFLQVWEQPAGAKESQWVFSGWMFASSPALSAMDHPIYDVWVLGCLGPDPEPASPSDEAEASDESVDEGVATDAASEPAQEGSEEKADTQPPATELKAEPNLQDETDQLLDDLTGGSDQPE